MLGERLAQAGLHLLAAGGLADRLVGQLLEPLDERVDGPVAEPPRDVGVERQVVIGCAGRGGHRERPYG